MLKFHNYDIVFQEIPDEVTLAVNITNCPNRCGGCHSPHLQQDTGQELDPGTLAQLVGPYREAVTCLCFMGGDVDPLEVARLARGAREAFPGLKTAWYSGRAEIPPGVDPRSFSYIKLGGYDAARGGLKSKETNQRLYAVDAAGALDDITHRIWGR